MLVNGGDRSKPKLLKHPYPIFSSDQLAELSGGKQNDTRVFSFFSFPIVVGGCAESNAYVTTMNKDPHSPFQVRNGPFLIDSFLFAAKVLVSMGLEVSHYEEIYALDRWDLRAFELAYKSLKSFPLHYFQLLRDCHWCWADGAQNDSHARETLLF